MQRLFPVWADGNVKVIDNTTKILYYILILYFTTLTTFWWDMKNNVNLSNGKQLQISEMWQSIYVSDFLYFVMY